MNFFLCTSLSLSLFPFTLSLALSLWNIEVKGCIFSISHTQLSNLKFWISSRLHLSMGKFKIIFFLDCEKVKFHRNYWPKFGKTLDEAKGLLIQSRKSCRNDWYVYTFINICYIYTNWNVPNIHQPCINAPKDRISGIFHFMAFL